MKLAGAKSCMVTSSVCCTAHMRTCDPLTDAGPSLYRRREPPQLSASLQSPLTCAYNPAAVSSFAPYGRMPSIRRLSINVVRMRATASSQRHQVFPSNANCAQVQSRKRRMSLYGFFFLASSATWMIAIFPFVVLAGLLARVFDPKRQRPAAALIQLWARLSLSFAFISPKLLGLQNIPPPGDTPVIYIPNHTSLLDIPVTGFLPRVLHYISKSEVVLVPFIGWSLVLAGNLLVRRGCSFSTRKVTEKAARKLKNGYSLVIFAEGERSKNGRLGEFKRGPFLMAQKAKASIIPVSICGVGEVMPTGTFLPTFCPRITMRLHPYINTNGRELNDIMKETRDAVASGL
eukprot:403435_1